MSVWQTFVPDGETIAISIKNLGECVGPIEKDEQTVGDRIGIEGISFFVTIQPFGARPFFTLNCTNCGF